MNTYSTTASYDAIIFSALSSGNATYYIFAGKLDLQDRHRFDKRVSFLDLNTDSTPKIN